jgi:hypothetical protein
MKGRTEEILLSSRGLEKASIIEPNTFRFIIGGEELKCNRFQAAFISDKVYKLLLSDSTIDHFEICGIQEGNEDFGGFVSLMIGSSIVLNETNLGVLLSIAESIENRELLGRIRSFEMSFSEPLSIDNCWSILNKKNKYEVECEEELDFISSNFYEMKTEDLKNQELEILERILSRNCLRLESEDELVELINELGIGFESLYNFVECKYLTKKGIEDFINLLENERIQMNNEIWTSICNRLRCDIQLEDDSQDKEYTRFRDVIEEVGYAEGGESNGILGFLRNKCGGDLRDKGMVEVSCSTELSGYSRWNAANPDESHYQSDGSSKAWICFDFKERSVKVDRYLVKGHENLYPLQWAIEGSNDAKEWTRIDERDTKELQGGVMKSFKCEGKGSSKYFRMIRFMQLGQSSRNDDYLVLCMLEFFGSLKTPRISKS